MNFLSVQNTFNKPHNNSTFFFPETPQRNTFTDNKQIKENNNQLNSSCQEKTLQEVWSKHNFNLSKAKAEQMVSLNNVKMCWAEQKPTEKIGEPAKDPPDVEMKSDDIQEVEQEQASTKEESPSHHARRPPNAFLIFCKKHRPIVRDRFPNLENRGVTKILGEWWALLSNGEKQPYNDLAKEYKDAFLSANPNFRWYKLPAPPLRTLTTRPMTLAKVPAPLSSPSNSLMSEFTPGKLADESQLGGLTSLMNNNFPAAPKTELSEDEGGHTKLEKVVDSSMISPISNINVSTPPKPIKKRFTEFYLDEKKCSRNILAEVEDERKETEELDKDESGNMTKQDLMNKVVDGMFAKDPYDSAEKNGLREVRKSERMCKGKRYEVFMIEGKLLGNKRESKWIHQRQNNRIVSKIETDLNTINNNNNNDINIKKPETPKLDLSDTIKRLAERTNVKIDFDKQSNVDKETTDQNQNKRVRSISETSDGSVKNSQNNFNLDLRISNLPCLGYDEFLQRKRESKKRKIRTKTDGDIKQKVQKLDNSDSQLVGSKKRKNKQSITHLGKKDDTLNNELLGLATLAEVAANTEKINESLSDY